MDRSTQRIFRFLIPGFLVAVWAFPFVTGKFNLADALAAFTPGEGGLLFALALVFGFIYELTGLHGYFAKQAFAPVNARLIKGLVGLKGIALTLDERKRLESDPRVLQVFWMVLDSNDSLKSKASAAYFNGTLVTASVDLVVIAGIGGLVHLVAWVLTDPPAAGSVWWLGASTAMVAAGIVGTFVFVRRHAAIGRDQLEFMEINLVNQVEEHLVRLAQNRTDVMG